MSPQSPTLQNHLTEAPGNDGGITTQSDVLRDPRMQTVIEYYALGGLMTDEEGELRKMPVTELADLLRVDRSTIYDWRDTIPDFWGRVAATRSRLGGQNRVQKVWNGVYLRAAKGDAEQAKMFLTNFDDNFRMPNDKADRTAAETLVGLMNAARQLKREQDQGQPAQQPLTVAPMPASNVIEGETAG